MTIPVGVCHCGCGQPTTIVPETGHGYRKGEHRRFLAGHFGRSIKGCGVLGSRACKACGASFVVTTKNRQQTFCSMKCIGAHKKRFGKYYPTTDGRRDHIIIAERALGRQLPVGVVVHHFNRSIRDASNSNLVMCQDQAYHMLLHARQRVKDAGGDPNTDKICHKCKQVKPKVEFSPSSHQGRPRLSSACRECAAVAQRDFKARRRRLRRFGATA